jgi:TRAP-type C4-dicarboxylate transport system permease small subunit
LQRLGKGPVNFHESTLFLLLLHINFGSANELSMFKVFLSISNFFKNSATWTATILLAFVAFILLLQVILRYLFNAALAWPEEASRYAMIWVVLLMGSVLVRDKELVSVDIFDRLWPEKVILYRDVAYRVLLLVLLVVLFKEGIAQAIAGWKFRTTALEIRWFWPYLAIPVGSGLMLFQMLFLAIEDFRNLKQKKGQNND